jgi:hypothetical protein
MQIPLNFERIVVELLKVVPKEHLIDLESISIIDKFTLKKDKGAWGIYKQKYGLEQARIEIAVEYLYNFKKPYMLRYFPLPGKIYLALVLYHEIGHHYRHFTHGVSEKDNEKFADQYRDKMFLKAFNYFPLFMKPYKIIATLLGLTQQKKVTPLGGSSQ